MGQKLQDDRLGTVSHSAGTISLAASVLTIGGQQYVTGILSRLITTDVTLSANGLYMVYAVVNSGVLELRISANVNSTGPVGFSAWKLVGAFYATAATTPIWGSFVTIEGVPCTLTDISDNNSAQLLSAFAGFSGFTFAYQWSRIGRSLFVTWRMDTVTGSGVSARLPLPRGGITGIENQGAIGTYAGQNGATNAAGGSIIGVGSTDVGFAGQNGANLSPSAISLNSGSTVAGTAPTTLTGSFRHHISQWSATPLKDL